MRILADIHNYLGAPIAGSEKYISNILEYFFSKGHQVKVLTKGISDRVINGVSVTSNHELIEDLYNEADVVFTQVYRTPNVIKNCRINSKPCVYFCHNTSNVPYMEIKTKDLSKIVYNAEWNRNYHENRLNFKHPDSYVLIPHVKLKEYNCPIDNKYITQVNMSIMKGLLTFIQASKMFPTESFLGVLGGHSDQVTENLPENITLQHHTDQVDRDIWNKTKLFLSPSEKESWGMAAVEAMMSGIPVIGHPTEGLMEALGSAGLFALRDKAYVWESLIKKLLENREYYYEKSIECYHRAKEIHQISQEQLEVFYESFM